MRRFATTRWSLVLHASKEDRDGGPEALAELCESYWHPLYAFLRRRGHDEEDARDLTQAFFSKLLSDRGLSKASPERGRFRTFLLTAMKNFAAGEWRKEQALKRGGGLEILSLDFPAGESAYQTGVDVALSPERVYERRWALATLDRALATLRARYEKSGRGELFDVLKGFLGVAEAERTYAEAAQALEKSEGAVRVAVTRLRAAWREELREQVASTVSDAGQVDEELRNLLAALSA